MYVYWYACEHWEHFNQWYNAFLDACGNQYNESSLIHVVLIPLFLRYSALDDLSDFDDC
jgi:hypothetical protein